MQWQPTCHLRASFYQKSAKILDGDSPVKHPGKRYPKRSDRPKLDGRLPLFKQLTRRRVRRTTRPEI